MAGSDGGASKFLAKTCHEDSNGLRASIFWAKSKSGKQWHSLPCHLLDVAAAAETLYDLLPNASTVLVKRTFGSEDIARRAVVFFAGAHDVGKANGFFQKKDRAQKQRVEELGVVLPTLDELKQHGQATGAFLKPWLMRRWGWDRLTADCVARAIGGHHGKFYEDCNQSSLSVQQEPWCTIGSTLLDTLAEILDVENPGLPTSLNPFLGWLAGFISVADWLGSHEKMTTWESQEHNPAEYLSEARSRAKELLELLKWESPKVTQALSLKELVPSGRKPNALQLAATEITSDFSLAIVEAPTGEGKTEAAFALAETCRSAGAGIYFALPTMSTANGLYNRVQAYLQRGAGDQDVEARLLHSQAWLFREEAYTARNPGKEGDDQEIQFQDWFAGAKRGLLTPYGVGTIDQALIAALRTKHGFVRLFALAGKTVVIDEVHAYDVYMADLMDVLLGWLRALGCQVILLSATLPKARREALLRAWGIEDDLPEAVYPCITWTGSGGSVQTRNFKVQKRKSLTIQPFAPVKGELWAHGAARIWERVREEGGLGALVLNTVRDAQSAYDWLCDQGLVGIDVDLFHARFTSQDRDSIEKRVLQHYGKDGERTKPRILVATQVVEQSLDLDFDHMVSALAPIDLLIQRAGRLHRHKRHVDGRLNETGDLDERANPVLDVLCPLADGKIGPDRVYSQDVLLYTLHLIKDGLRIAQPSDVAQAIDSVYSERDRVAVLAAWRDKLEEFENKVAKRNQKQHEDADRATISRVYDPDNLIVDEFLDLDENDERQSSQLVARTRLEDRPSITVALLQDERTTIHGGQVSHLRDGLFACVRCSPPFPLWEALMQIDPLSAWQGKGSLSYTRPLLLEEGSVQVDDYILSYSPTRGLDWRRMNADV